MEKNAHRRPADAPDHSHTRHSQGRVEAGGHNGDRHRHVANHLDTKKRNIHKNKINKTKKKKDKNKILKMKYEK